MLYTGEGVAGSELAIDKIATKKRFIERGVPTAAFEILRDGAAPKLPIPYVVKAPREGSSVGVFIVRDAAKVDDTLREAREFGSELLVEQFVAGRELTVGIVGDQAAVAVDVHTGGRGPDRAHCGDLRLVHVLSGRAGAEEMPAGKGRRLHDRRRAVRGQRRAARPLTWRR